MVMLSIKLPNTEIIFFKKDKHLVHCEVLEIWAESLSTIWGSILQKVHLR